MCIRDSIKTRTDLAVEAITAVNVQAMFPAVASGVLFTADPMDGSANDGTRADRIFVEAVSGLGQKLVSGQATPARFEIDRTTCKVVRSQNEASIAGTGLGHSVIEKLARQSLELEAKAEHPIDLEWGYREGRFAFLQFLSLIHI